MQFTTIMCTNRPTNWKLRTTVRFNLITARLRSDAIKKKFSFVQSCRLIQKTWRIHWQIRKKKKKSHISLWGSQSSEDLREGESPVMAKEHIWKPQVLNRVWMLLHVFHPTAQLWRSSGSELYQKPVLRQKWMLPFTKLALVDWPHSLHTVADIFVSCTTSAGCLQ